MTVKKAAGLVGTILWTCCIYAEAEIHRVKSQSMRTAPQTHHHPYNLPPSDSSDALTHSKTSNTTEYTRGEMWFYSIITSLIVGLSGIFPLLILPLEAGPSLQKEENARKLRLFLSFAVGSLLGDVFLHLLPESWRHVHSDHSDQLTIGMWVLAGIFSFIILEKILPNLQIFCQFKKTQVKEDPLPSEALDALPDETLHSIDKNGFQKNGYTKEQQNGYTNGFSLKEKRMKNGFKHKELNGRNGPKYKTHKDKEDLQRSGKEKFPSKSTTALTSLEMTGYLNLLANSIDNFTHGLAVAASFLVSYKVGMLTAFAILIHEIPHEIGDFAILLKSGFNRFAAAKAQLITASGGLLGAIVALSADSAEEIGNRTAWILPFTAGGFINIALVNVLPDLLKESNPRESGKQLLALLMGISIMALVTKVCD